MNKKELILKKTNIISLIALLGAVVYWSVALVVLFCFEEWLLSWWTSNMSFIGASILLLFEVFLIETLMTGMVDKLDTKLLNTLESKDVLSISFIKYL